jgi:hypothetical protein
MFRHFPGSHSLAAGLALLAFLHGAVAIAAPPRATPVPSAAVARASAAPPAAPTPPPAATASATPAPLSESLTGAAKAEYAASRILYDDGDFRGALEKLKRTYDLSNDPRLLWNMAACQKNLRRYAEVVRLVEVYLRDGGAYMTGSDRADATALLETVKAFVCDLQVESNEGGATLYFDDQPLGSTPFAGPVQVDMGVHKIRLSKPGFVDYTATPDLPGGQGFKVSAQLVQEHHEGRLRVVAEPVDVIQVDGKAVGTGLWEGALAIGTHAVFLSAQGKLAYRTDVVVSEGQINSIHVSLQDEPRQALMIEKSGVPAWVWATGGALLVGGVVGTYFLLKPNGTSFEHPTEGNWGAISL